MVPQTLSSSVIQSLIYNNHSGRKEVERESLKLVYSFLNR